MRPNKDGTFSCFQCGSNFASGSALSRHKSTKHTDRVVIYKCPHCTHESSRAYDILTRHMPINHPQATGATLSDLEQVSRRRPATVKGSSSVALVSLKGKEVPSPNNRRAKNVDVTPRRESRPAALPEDSAHSSGTSRKDAKKRVRSPSPSSSVTKRERREEASISPICSETLGTPPGFILELPMMPVGQKSAFDSESEEDEEPTDRQEVVFSTPEVLHRTVLLQTGSLGEKTSSSAVQTTPSVRRQERSQRAQTSGSAAKEMPVSYEVPPVHRHRVTTTYYPDGRREVVEEDVWWTQQAEYPCCQRRLQAYVPPGIPDDIPLYIPSVIQ